MDEILKAFPQQFVAGYEAAGDAGSAFASRSFEQVIIAGTGGSALPGNVLRTVSADIQNPVPVIVHRDYHLPIAPQRKNALIVVISYSGNTEEALDAYEHAKQMDLPVVVITSGGALKEKAEANMDALALVPGGLQPRFALGYQFSALLAVLANANIIPSQKDAMNALAESLDVDAARNTAEGIAAHIGEATPVIYASQKYHSVAYIMKIQMNENAKMHAFSNIFPELNHNEMMGYVSEQKNSFATIILRADDDDERIRQRQKLTADIITEHGGNVFILDIAGKDCYSKVFNTVLIGNWVSLRLAEAKGIDPSPVAAVEDFKNRLRALREQSGSTPI